MSSDTRQGVFVKRCLIVLEKPALERADCRTNSHCDTRPRNESRLVRNTRTGGIVMPREMAEIGGNVEGGTRANPPGRKVIVWILRLNASTGALPALVYTEGLGWDFYLMKEPRAFDHGPLPERPTLAKDRVAFGVFEVADGVFRSIGCELIVIRSAP
jgi:hypothetical protein